MTAREARATAVKDWVALAKYVKTSVAENVPIRTATAPMVHAVVVISLLIQDPDSVPDSDARCVTSVILAANAAVVMTPKIPHATV